MEVITMKNDTIRKLQEMKLSVMAKAYMDQIENPEQYADMTFDERLTLIVGKESDARLNNKLKRLIKNAHFPTARLIFPGFSIFLTVTWIGISSTI